MSRYSQIRGKIVSKITEYLNLNINGIENLLVLKGYLKSPSEHIIEELMQNVKYLESLYRSLCLLKQKEEDSKTKDQTPALYSRVEILRCYVEALKIEQGIPLTAQDKTYDPFDPISFNVVMNACIKADGHSIFGRNSEHSAIKLLRALKSEIEKQLFEYNDVTLNELLKEHKKEAENNQQLAVKAYESLRDILTPIMRDPYIKQKHPQQYLELSQKIPMLTDDNQTINNTNREPIIEEVNEESKVHSSPISQPTVTLKKLNPTLKANLEFVYVKAYENGKSMNEKLLNYKKLMITLIETAYNCTDEVKKRAYGHLAALLSVSKYEDVSNKIADMMQGFKDHGIVIDQKLQSELDNFKNDDVSPQPLCRDEIKLMAMPFIGLKAKDLLVNPIFAKSEATTMFEAIMNATSTTNPQNAGLSAADLQEKFLSVFKEATENYDKFLETNKYKVKVVDSERPTLTI